MKKPGLKSLLIISVTCLVGISVSVSSFILYVQEKENLTTLILNEYAGYASSQASLIETMVNEKVGGIHKLANFYKNKTITGTDEELIEKTHFLANAMNLNSAVLAFESGKAYWNQTADTWPNNRLNSDVREKSWYQAGRQAPSTTVTEPYVGAGNKYWITIAEKIKSGAVMTDMTLGFLDEITKKASAIVGSFVVILNEDTTLLASSSDLFKAGQKAKDFGTFNEVAQQIVKTKSATLEYLLEDQQQILFSKIINVGDKRWYFVIGLDKSLVFSKLVETKKRATLVALVLTLISMILTYFLIKFVYRPVLLLKNTIIDLSQGEADLTQRLPVDNNDDLGQIAEGINDFIAQLHSIMLELKGASTSLYLNVDQMKEQLNTNNTILHHHVTETNQVVTAIADMNDNANKMAEDANNTANVIKQANETSTDSRKIVEQSQQTVSSLIGGVEQEESDVNEMNKEAEGIGTILSVIDSIAEQTNLLALNAAIEAARAGEQGRGFAVVADEVRNLASRTKESTEEIESALHNLSQKTQVVVTAMDNTKVRCQETVDGSGEVTSSLNTMASFVDNINELSAKIATSAEIQSDVTQELNQNMAVIKDIVEKLDANGKQVLTDTGGITHVNKHLQEIVERFKL